MSTQKENLQENLLVKLIKKSVGLPTGKSGCCGVPAEHSNDRHDSSDSGECCSESSDGGCGNEGCSDDYCDVEDSGNKVGSAL